MARVLAPLGHRSTLRPALGPDSLLHGSASPVAARAAGALTLLLHFALPAQAQHDCLPYLATDAGQVIDSTWSVQLEQDDYEFTVPTDPGGGYVIVRVESTPPSQPRVRIIPPSGQGVVTQSGTADPGPSPYVLEVAFEVDADATYGVEIIEDVNAPIEDHPVSYQWSWTFFSKIDCYEPNDALPADWPDPKGVSRIVPLDQVLEAYSLAGHLSFAIPADALHGFDWYEFTLTAPTQLWLSTITVPVDQRTRLRLFDTNGSVVLDPPVPPLGQTAVVGPTLFQPGTYYLDIHPEVRGETQVTLSEGESLPDHFDRPYQFIVSTQEIPTCGFSSIFCDDFESTDTSAWQAAVP